MSTENKVIADLPEVSESTGLGIKLTIGPSHEDHCPRSRDGNLSSVRTDPPYLGLVVVRSK